MFRTRIERISASCWKGVPLDDWLCGVHQIDNWNAFRCGSKSSKSSYINHSLTGKCQVINVAWKSYQSRRNTRGQGGVCGCAALMKENIKYFWPHVIETVTIPELLWTNRACGCFTSPSSSACVIMPIQPKPIKFPIILSAWLGNCMKTASQIVKTPSAAVLWCIATSIFDDTATYIKAHKLTVEQQQPAACRSPTYRHKKRLLSVCLSVSVPHRHLDTQIIWSVPVFGGKNDSFGMQEKSVWFSLTVFFLFKGKHFIYRHTFSCAYLDRLAQGSPTRQCFRRWWCRWESRVRPRHNRARSCTGLGPPQRSGRCRWAPLWAGRRGFRRTCYGALYEGEKEEEKAGVRVLFRQ